MYTSQRNNELSHLVTLSFSYYSIRLLLVQTDSFISIEKTFGYILSSYYAREWFKKVGRKDKQTDSYITKEMHIDLMHTKYTL